MRSSSILAAAASGITAVNAVAQGFNYGSTQADGTIKVQSDYEAEFKAAQGLVGTSGFTSARLYTMIQGGTSSTPIEAIQAAIDTKTTLLLGLWASGGQAAFDLEITALKAAITAHGSDLTNLVEGISVGSEDLYRDSYTGQQANAGVGVGPDVVVSYISAVRSAIAGTVLSSVPVGHVDTWTAWVNGTNSEVINAVDFLGMDGYPYFQNTQANSIANAKGLFYDSYDATVAVAGGKSVWITETGWPVSGSTENEGVPSLANAKTYWDEVGCPSFGNVNIYWYTLQDTAGSTPNPSFGIVGSTLSTTPLFDLSCSNVTTSSTSSASASSTLASSVASSISSSAASVATSALATGGVGLSPSQGNGNGVASSLISQATSAATSASAASGSTGSASAAKTTAAASVTTIKTSVASGATGATAKSGTTTAAAATSTYTGAAVANAGSAMGGLVAAVAVALAAL